MNKKKISKFQNRMLSWYTNHKRDLPRRDTKNSYRVLVSEVMSQQTQVTRVIPKYEKFIKTLPGLNDLATCDKETLLRLWSGLGFNSRGLRLQQAAQVICDRYKGIIPADRFLLLDLPGIGPYTSAAICSFAFNLPEPVVDTNIRRVLISELGLDLSISNKNLEVVARECIPSGKSNDRHNALMDYGALVATSKTTGIKPLSKQSKFKGSDREVRGWIVKKLTAGAKNISIRDISTVFPDKKISHIVRGMIQDGLVVNRDGIISIS